MIATGNHNFERFAALCNTLGGKPRDASPLAVRKLLIRTVYYRAIAKRFLSGIVTGWAENQRVGTGLEAALPPKK